MDITTANYTRRPVDSSTPFYNNQNFSLLSGSSVFDTGSDLNEIVVMNLNEKPNAWYE